jgi:hypothetical protein
MDLCIITQWSNLTQSVGRETLLQIPLKRCVRKELARWI